MNEPLSEARLVELEKYVARMRTKCSVRAAFRHWRPPMPTAEEVYRVPTHARLADGRLVELEKECACVTHEGPHWLHMDRLDRLANQQTLMSLQAQIEKRSDAWFALYDAYARSQRERCREKWQEMERRGITQLLYPEDVTDAGR